MTHDFRRRHLEALIEAAYSAGEVGRFCACEVDRDTLYAVCDLGVEVQDSMELGGGRCRYMTAAWVKRVRNELSLPAVQVVGDLYAAGEDVYTVKDSARHCVDPSHPAHEGNWHGHSWLALGEQGIDLSITLTAVALEYDPHAHPALQGVVNRHLVDGSGNKLRIHCFPLHREQWELNYRAQGVYSDAVVERHIEIGRLEDRRMSEQRQKRQS